MTVNVQQVDIVISGGGLSGLLMALSLSEIKKTNGERLAIAIVEANPILEDSSLTFDDRVLALSHGSASYLKQLGAWDYLADSAAPIKNIHISERGCYGKARLVAQQHQVNALGFVIEMSLLGQALLKCVKAQQNISWFTPDIINDITWHTSHVELTLSSKTKLSTRLLLGCDGGNSACRQFANISITEHDYQQSALIANVSTAQPHNNIAYERFTETGPIAMLPLSSSKLSGNAFGKSRCSLVWTQTPAQATKLAELDDNAFKITLEKAFGSWLGEITHVGKRDVYPLKLLTANESIYHRMALIGNASHTIHPIAGQGFNLGVRDVQQLSMLVQQALDKGQDFGQFYWLNQYAQQRQTDHQQVIRLTDSLVTLFSNKLPPLVLARNIGLKVLNYVAPLKNALVKKTMGY